MSMTKFNHHDKKFRPVSNSENGETSKQTTFHYRQEGNVLIGENAGGNIRKGLLIGLVDEEGKIEMRYQQINYRNEFMTGICFSTPEVLSNGKISLHENWQWTSGDCLKATSVIEEI